MEERGTEITAKVAQWSRIVREQGITLWRRGAEAFTNRAGLRRSRSPLGSPAAPRRARFRRLPGSAQATARAISRSSSSSSMPDK